MRFDSWHYLYPPRPENAVTKNFLSLYEKQEYLAQIKLNGTANVLSISPDRKVTAMTRHKDNHKQWAPTAATAKVFANLPGDGWYVFVAELMHSKVPGIRDINYIHDVLVADGEYLVGTTLEERQKLLESLFGIDRSKVTKDTPISHFVIDANTWLVRNYRVGFAKLFETLDRPEYEGLVLKNPKAKLDYCSREKSNSTWQAKVRKPHKNYGF